MKIKHTILLFSLVLLLVFLNGFSQAPSLPKKPVETKTLFDVQQISSTAWNTTDGITYSEGPGSNLGATSFQIMDSRRIAFLCNSKSEIAIVDSKNGKVTKRFPVTFAPRDFIYDNNNFYVLSEMRIDVFDQSGNPLNTFLIDRKYAGAERIMRSQNSTYLILPSGNSIIIESNNEAAVKNEIDGWITESGNRVQTKLDGNYYHITILTQSGEKLESNFENSNKVAGVFLIGTTTNRLFLDVQTFITEVPVQVDRKIVSIEINNSSLGKIISEINIPKVYYVLSNNDLYVSSDGTLFNMITAPEGVFVFSLREKVVSSATINPYPAFLTEQNYHFNNHLINVEESK